jgi:hypothetical protein
MKAVFITAAMMIFGGFLAHFFIPYPDKSAKPIIHYPDKETLHDEQSTFASNVSRLLAFIYKEGYQCTLGEAWRSPEQAAIYAKEGKGIRDSLHCERLAIDLNLFDEDGKYLNDFDDYEHIGTFWESLHEDNEWGGRWKPSKEHPKQTVDMDHFEMKVEK